MSTVYNYLLTTSICEEHDDDDVFPAIEDLNRRINAAMGTTKAAFWPLHPHVHSGKAMEACVFGAALNHFDEVEVAKIMNEVDWKERDSVKLYVQGQEEDYFSLVFWQRLTGSEP